MEPNLRFILDALTDIADPVERLRAVEITRKAMADTLTTVYEKASWEARVTDRVEEAVANSSLTKTALLDYSIRYNRRLEGVGRKRWADPLRPHGLQDAIDLSQIGRRPATKKVRPRRSKRRPYRPKKRNPYVVQTPQVMEDHPANTLGDRWKERRPPVTDDAKVDQVLRHVEPSRATLAPSSSMVNLLPHPRTSFATPAGAGLDDGADPGGNHGT